MYLFITIPKCGAKSRGKYGRYLKQRQNGQDTRKKGVESEYSLQNKRVLRRRRSHTIVNVSSMIAKTGPGFIIGHLTGPLKLTRRSAK